MHVRTTFSYIFKCIPYRIIITSISYKMSYSSTMFYSLFEMFAKKTYGLDPCHYYTAPGLTWDAGLKYTRVTLDLLTDEDMFLFVEDGIRGGISMITHRYAKANHPDLADIGYYNKEKPLCNLLYLDANNLYGWAMMQCLPVGDFEWLTRDDIKTTMTLPKIRSLPHDSKRGSPYHILY